MDLKPELNDPNPDPTSHSKQLTQSGPKTEIDLNLPKQIFYNFFFFLARLTYWTKNRMTQSQPNPKTSQPGTEINRIWLTQPNMKIIQPETKPNDPFVRSIESRLNERGHQLSKVPLLLHRCFASSGHQKSEYKLIAESDFVNAIMWLLRYKVEPQQRDLHID